MCTCFIADVLVLLQFTLLLVYVAEKYKITVAVNEMCAPRENYMLLFLVKTGQSNYQVKVSPVTEE